MWFYVSHCFPLSLCSDPSPAVNMSHDVFHSQLTSYTLTFLQAFPSLASLSLPDWSHGSVTAWCFSELFVNCSLIQVRQIKPACLFWTHYNINTLAYLLTYVCEQVSVADARQKIVKFGALRIGQTLKKIVPIVNNSGAPLTFNVTLNPVTPELQEPGVVRLLPSEQPITLQAKGGMAKVEVMLSPKTRVSQFSEEVKYVTPFCNFEDLWFISVGLLV